MRSILLVLFFSSALFAQFDVPDELKKATVVIEAGGGWGSGSVIKIGDKKYVLTAAHVTNKRVGNDISSEPRPNITAIFHDLIPVTMTVALSDHKLDVSILEGEVPPNTPFLEICEDEVKFRDEVKMLVRTGASILDSNIQLRRGCIAPNTTSEEIVIGNYLGMADPNYDAALDCWIQPGDSGSALLNKDNKIVGVLVRGGTPYYEATNGKGDKGRALWPAYASGLKAVRDLVQKLQSDTNADVQEKTGFLTYAEFVAAQKKKGGTYYVLISANWCAPCQVLKARLRREIRTPVYLLDYDGSPEAAKTFLKGRGIPALFRIKVTSPDVIDEIVTYKNGDLKEFFGEK